MVVGIQMKDYEVWIITLKVWRNIIQKGTPSSFRRVLYGKIKQGYTFDHRFYEALQISLLSNKYGKPTPKHHYVTVYGSEDSGEKTGVRLRTRAGNEGSWSHPRVWGTGRGSRAQKSEGKSKKNR